LIEYSYTLDDSHIETLFAEDKPEIISFSVIAKSFLKYYWHQICKYKIKQNYNLDKPPLIVKIIHNVFGKEYIPESFESMPKEKITMALREIEKKCFLEVIPRFQNISDGIKVISKNIFYNYDGNSLSVKPNILKYFKANHFF